MSWRVSNYVPYTYINSFFFSASFSTVRLNERCTLDELIIRARLRLQSKPTLNFMPDEIANCNLTFRARYSRTRIISISDGVLLVLIFHTDDMIFQPKVSRVCLKSILLMILNDHFKLMRFTCVIAQLARVKKQNKKSEFQYDGS